MSNEENTFAPGAEALIADIREQARNLYQSRQLLCTEAVLVAINERLAAPFSAAMGESGCLCGALSGAVMACGLALGKDRPRRHRREIRAGARKLHDAFKAANGATCCRLLTRGVCRDKGGHFRQCADLTAEAAGMGVRLILQERPELIARASNGRYPGRHSKIAGAFLRTWRYLTT